MTQALCEICGRRQPKGGQGCSSDFPEECWRTPGKTNAPLVLIECYRLGLLRLDEALSAEQAASEKMKATALALLPFVESFSDMLGEGSDQAEIERAGAAARKAREDLGLPVRIEELLAATTKERDALRAALADLVLLHDIPGGEARKMEMWKAARQLIAPNTQATDV